MLQSKKMNIYKYKSSFVYILILILITTFLWNSAALAMKMKRKASEMEKAGTIPPTNLATTPQDEEEEEAPKKNQTEVIDLTGDSEDEKDKSNKPSKKKQRTGKKSTINLPSECTLYPYGVREVYVDPDKANEITYISIRGSIMNPITDDTLRLLTQFPNLVALELIWCSEVTNKGLQDLATICPNLIKLRLWRWEKMSNAALQYLPKTLTQLSLQACQNITDLSHIQHLTSLTYLDLSSTGITDETLQHLPSSLTRLHLSGCSDITKAGLQHLEQYCPVLVRLHLGGKEMKISNADLQYLPRTLTTLSLKGWQITPQTLQHLPENITQLDLSSTVISNDALKYLSNSLTQLNLSFTNISDQVLECLPISIKKLSLVCCLEITDDALRNIADHLPNLEVLNLKGCPNIDNNGFKYVARQYVAGKFSKLKWVKFSNEHVLQGDNLDWYLKHRGQASYSFNDYLEAGAHLIRDYCSLQ